MYFDICNNNLIIRLLKEIPESMHRGDQRPLVVSTRTLYGASSSWSTNLAADTPTARGSRIGNQSGSAHESGNTVTLGFSRENWIKRSKIVLHSLIEDLDRSLRSSARPENRRVQQTSAVPFLSQRVGRATSREKPVFYPVIYLKCSRH